MHLHSFISLSFLLLQALSTNAAKLCAKRATPVLPPAGGIIDYQIGGAYEPDSKVQIVTRDHTDCIEPDKYNICYINAFQTQPGDTSWESDLLLKTNSGENTEDPDWPGEFILDTTTDEKRTRLAEIVKAWITGCKDNGFDGVEFDNLDTYTHFKTLSIDGNLAYAKLLVDHAHSLGLAAGQKNTVEAAKRAKAEVGFDFAVAEECQEWKECDGYTDVYGKLVMEIEYDKQAFEDACEAWATEASVIFRDVGVAPKGEGGYEYATCE